LRNVGLDSSSEQVDVFRNQKLLVAHSLGSWPQPRSLPLPRHNLI
jgi:hypothetical protein